MTILVLISSPALSSSLSASASKAPPLSLTISTCLALAPSPSPDHASFFQHIYEARRSGVTDFQPPLQIGSGGLAGLNDYLPGLFVKVVVRFIRDFVKVYRKSALSFSISSRFVLGRTHIFKVNILYWSAI